MTKVHYSAKAPAPVRLTKRQAEALCAARERGNVAVLRGHSMGGAMRAMFARLGKKGLIHWGWGLGGSTASQHGQITQAGLAELALWEQTHPKTRLNPRVSERKA